MNRVWWPTLPARPICRFAKARSILKALAFRMATAIRKRRCSTISNCIFPQVSALASSAFPARAKRRSRSFCFACPIFSRGAFFLMGKTSRNARSSRCVAKSPMCRRNRCCSTAALPRISRTASRAPAWMRFAKRRRVRTRWNSSNACLRASKPRSASAA